MVARQGGFEICALAAGGNYKLLAEQARQFNVPRVALAQGDAAGALKELLPATTQLMAGPSAMTEIIHASQPDVVLSGVVGAAGLGPTLAAIDVGADLAIANKETLVMAGAIVMPAARARKISILPVDSEHSAIFQCLAAGRRDEVRRVVITGSGGSLRNRSDEQAAQATVADALNHPTWDMGPKITIDSATMINKALEVVEAHWLFDLPAEQIEVLQHPQSIVHSYVEFHDGSIIAQMGWPDMMLPIAYALSFPRRPRRETPSLDLAQVGTLNFSALAGRCRRAVELGFEAIRRGGLAGAALSGANERAVAAFLEGRISFGRLVPLVEAALNSTPACGEVTLEALIEADAWARRKVDECIAATADARP